MKGDYSTLKFKNGVKDGLPIGLGYLSVSIAFGVKASLAGVPVFVAVMISMTNLTSAGQLAGLEVIASLGTFLEIILTQLVINARYFLMSVSLSQKADQSFTFGSRLLCSAFITDEIFGVAVSKPKTIGKNYFLGLALLPYIGWALGTLIGATLGSVLPTFIASALGIALYAMFIAIIVPPAMTNRGVLFTVVVSVALSCAFYFIPFLQAISSSFATIITAVLTATIAALLFPINDKEKE